MMIDVLGLSYEGMRRRGEACVEFGEIVHSNGSSPTSPIATLPQPQR